MSDTVVAMPKKPEKKGAKGGQKPNRFPSSDKIKYAGIPKDYWEMLDSLTAEGMKHEGRSVAYLTKLAVRAFLQAEGVLDASGRPKPEGG